MWGQKLWVWKPGSQGEHRPGETGEKSPAPGLRLSPLRATGAKWPPLASGLGHWGVSVCKALFRVAWWVVEPGSRVGWWQTARRLCVWGTFGWTLRLYQGGCLRAVSKGPHGQVCQKGVLLFPRGRPFEPGGMIRGQIPEDLVILCEKVWGLFVKHGGAIENTRGYLNYEPPLEDNFDQDVAKHLHP